MSKTFKPGFASPISSAREERKSSAALLKVATFKTKNYDANEKYASAMSARQSMSSNMMMSVIALPKKHQNILAEKTNTPLIKVSNTFKQQNTNPIKRDDYVTSRKENGRYAQARELSPEEDYSAKAGLVSHLNQNHMLFDQENHQEEVAMRSVRHDQN